MKKNEKAFEVFEGCFYGWHDIYIVPTEEEAIRAVEKSYCPCCGGSTEASYRPV